MLVEEQEAVGTLESEERKQEEQEIFLFTISRYVHHHVGSQ